MSNQLVYFELHVDNETFYVHGIVEAETPGKACDILKSIHGKNYDLQIKGFRGEATKRKMIDCLKDSIPEDALVKKTQKKRIAKKLGR